jgi:hypothetical protein
MKIKKIIHFKFITLLVMSGILGLFLMLFPVKQVKSADDPLPIITAESVRNNALAKGLKSLRVAIQEDATNDIGLPLLLGPKSPQRNVPLSIDLPNLQTRRMPARLPPNSVRLCSGTWLWAVTVRLAPPVTSTLALITVLKTN